ncbi:helix-turn-helix transcriptional regulator [Hoeflea sp.]|uniref:helix-turn-helix transcriptional regulator n=1 Tax=Hoeflea sp. TaxID=1940281 RepID=UPI0037491203
MRNAVRHIIFFRTTTHRGLETFRLLVASEDLDLDRLLRKVIRNTVNLDFFETLPERDTIQNHIVISDCREHVSENEASTLPNCGTDIANIALIVPDPQCRHNAYMTGFADFLCWPIISQELFSRLLAQSRACSLKDPNHRYSRVAMVERCCAFMAEQMASPLSIRSLARKFNTNHNTLNEVFKREMGLPPLTWQRKLRMERAAHQLRLTNTPINIIAADHGYELPANFTTAFRRHFGVTPHQYRKNEQII